ncbi:MAG: phosphomethylpyrimidine synthase ThiC [Cyanobacteriota bacterium]
MTQLLSAKAGKITPELEQVAVQEKIDQNVLLDRVSKGEVVILANINHKNVIPTGVGNGLKVKVNANIGTSHKKSEISNEMHKLRVCEEAKADTVMDLSTGNDIDETRRKLISSTSLPLGTVPIYQAGVDAININDKIESLDEDQLFRDIEKHCKDGVDFITVHCGVTQEVVQALKEQGRVCGIVSRGGSMLAAWMEKNKRQNPLYTRYDDLLDIARAYDTTLSLGDGLRPGCGNDAGDRAQYMETIVLGELVNRARKASVQTMIEGPGHVPLHLIKGMIQQIKVLTQNAPLYVLGPLVTDIAPGYDHITSAIGGAIAASSGADFLCYVTPSEHLGLPEVEQVKAGIIATRIAAHAADVSNGNQYSINQDLLMSKARFALDWKAQANHSIDPDVFNEYKLLEDKEGCTMCGKFCSMKQMQEHLVGTGSKK